MDPAVASTLAHALVPVLSCLFVFGMPVAIVFITKHFKLKNRELELEAELHSRELEMRLRSLEARQSAIESALGVIGGRPPASLEERASAEASGSPEAEARGDPQRLRSR
jgi:hypothetical protein